MQAIALALTCLACSNLGCRLLTAEATSTQMKFTSTALHSNPRHAAKHSQPNARVGEALASSTSKALAKCLHAMSSVAGWQVHGAERAFTAKAARLREVAMKVAVGTAAEAGSIQGSGAAKVAGRTAVVTGSSQGCGKATALALAKRGWNVVLAARQPERLAKAAAEVEGVAKAAGRRVSVLGVPCDIAESTDVDALSAAVLERYERVDLLVNNAGVCQTASFDWTSVDEYERLMQTNFMGAVRVTKALLPALKASKGTIVNVNSFGGVIPLRGMSAYTASKFALAGWSEALRAELQPAGVHVAQVHPGIMKSDWLERAVFEKDDGAAKMRQVVESAPFIPKPEEVAMAVLDAHEKQKQEVTVGGFFQAAIAAYRLTGANLFAVQDPNSRV